MWIGRKGSLIILCVWLLAVIQNGEGIKCYECSGSMTNRTLCLDPFHGTNVPDVSCDGVCFKVTATVSFPHVITDDITARGCDELDKNTCRAISVRLENLMPGIQVENFDCRTCSEDLCNSGHLPSSANWVIITTLALAAFTLILTA